MRLVGATIQSPPLIKLDNEINRLHELYQTSVFSYRDSARSLTRKINSKEIQPSDPIDLTLLGIPGEPVARNAYSLRTRLNSVFPKYLRELIFVRIISALEVFLADVVREIFLSRRDLFHIDGGVIYIDFFPVGEPISVSIW